MLRNCCSILLLCLLTTYSYAQSFYKVTNLMGTEYVAGNAVTVHHIGYVANSYSACATGPYRISITEKRYRAGYLPGLCFRICRTCNKSTRTAYHVGPRELISFHVNGTFYPVSAADLSDYGSTCKGALLSVVKNGRVGGDTSNTNALVTIDPGFLIDSVMVHYDTNDDAGVHFLSNLRATRKSASNNHFLIPLNVPAIR